jgi:hypothetical protein
LRTGDKLGDRVIAAIKLLQARAGSIGATRSFSDASQSQRSSLHRQEHGHHPP